MSASGGKGMVELARDAVAAAKARGASGARAQATRERTSRVEWRDGKLDRVRESTRVSLAVALFVEGRWSSSSTSDLRPDAVARFLDEAVATTRWLTPDPDRVLPDPARYAGRAEGDLGLWDAPGLADAARERRRLAADLEKAARAAPGADRIVSVTTSASDSEAHGAMVTSNGMEGTTRRTSFSLSATVSVSDERGRKPVGWWGATVRARPKLPAPGEIGPEATRRALASIGSAPRPTGTYSCIIEAPAVGRLVGSLTDALQGQNVQQRRSFLAGKVGTAVASPVLDLTDDPLLSEGLGTVPYDGEGMSTRRRPLLEKGVLRGYVLDTYYARKLGLEPTSGRLGNLVFGTGTRNLDALLAAMGKGILVTDFVGGNSNSATGDFSFGVRGHWIEGGRAASPVSEMNLSGNHLDFWKRLAEPGADAFAWSDVRAPSLRFDEAQFSGS